MDPRLTAALAKTALVTGASSGIGAAVVRLLAKNGLAVQAIARRRERLAALASETGCVAHTLDVTQTKALHQLLGGLSVDVLVNNVGTGVGFAEHLAAVDPATLDTVVATNMTATLQACRAVMPGMLERGHGHIVTIGSVGGLYPVRQVLYGAAKGGLHLLNQNLRIELLGTGIRVTEICPGSTRTEFVDHAFRDEPTGEAAFLDSCEILAPEDVAEAVLFALTRPAHVNVNTIELTPTGEALGGIHHSAAAR